MSNKALAPHTPAFGVSTAPETQSPQQAQLPPEVQAMLTAAQNSLPPWARWLFVAAVGPLLLTTYNGAKDIWGVPEAQKGIITKMNEHDKTIADLVAAQKTLSENVSTLTTSVVNISSSVQRLSDQLYYMNFSPASQPVRNPGK